MGARTLQRLNSVLEAEAEALRWAILTVTNLDYRMVIFETDSKMLVEAMMDENPRPILSVVQQDIQTLLPRVQAYQLVFSLREGNRVADRIIAQETHSFQDDVPKLYSCMSEWIILFIEDDKMTL
ncbi:uncharacterized protein LOC112082821 [Eutrema salsugineum]|uniref:uncharacterized protein LOC112082821 n=1 Tax=Eutrema salsugineum TaxID=72664 RepID=UPI000CED4943|nr:uncharacterized protein LOC112082821 [Eutrema salsugineum]